MSHRLGKVTITPDGRPFDPSRQALNLLDGALHPHHPVMRRIPQMAYSLERDHLVELSGLRVPAHYDCDIFNNGSSFGNHYYFFEVPSRWYACYQHRAALLSGLPFATPMLPMVDDEYHEAVAVYHTVLRAVHAHRRNPQRALVFGELGARWGTWGGRAASLARLLAPSMPTRLYFVEAHEPNCAALETTMNLNQFTNEQYTLVCARATAARLLEWARSIEHIDALDLDIQGAGACPRL